ncbi:hypothetical protein H2201_003689 [Coniosporium apollinis]|uniref:Uncharacterized protein n=1 Tax=Coniosporium apollinis TaxID=61459 RepID=A0ABQ9NV22_9PEZI|nr:hypothetical protein H2201_003689 [Coniosporium apollinis]
MTTLYTSQPPPPQATYPDPYAQPAAFAHPQNYRPNQQYFQPPYNPQQQQPPYVQQQQQQQQQPPPLQPTVPPSNDPYAPQPPYQQAHHPSLAPPDPFAANHGAPRRSSDFTAAAFDPSRRRSSSPARNRHARHSLDFTRLEGDNDGEVGGGRRHSQPSHHAPRRSHHSERRHDHRHGREYGDGVMGDASESAERRPTLGDTMFAIWDRVTGRGRSV